MMCFFFTSLQTILFGPLTLINIFLGKLMGSFLVLQTGSISNWHDTKDGKDNEQYPLCNTKVNQRPCQGKFRQATWPKK